MYVRVSTEEQVRHGHSLGAQEEDCRRRARSLGYRDDQVLLIREEGVSGEAVDRPGLNRLRDLVAAGGVRHVVMYDPDRFARNLSLQLIVTDEIVRAGAQLEFVNFEWRDTPEGRLFYSLRGAIAEYEKAKIKERTRRGRERMVKEGKLPSDPRLFGYRWDPALARFEPDTPAFETLQFIKELALGGASAHAICRRLAAAGVPAPRSARWHPSTVWKLLRNPDYTGTYWTGKRGGTRRSFQLPPAWDEETRARLLGSAAAHRGGGARSQALLAGLLYCGCCGGQVRMGLRAAGGYRYYACNRKARVAYGPGETRTTGCPGGYWPAHELEEAVWAAAGRLLAGLEPPQTPTRRTGEEASLHRAVQDGRRREERLLDLYLSGRIDRALYDREQTALTERRRAAEERLVALAAPAIPASSGLRTAMHPLPEAARRGLLQVLAPRIAVGPGRSVTLYCPLSKQN